MELENGKVDTVEGFIDWKGNPARRDKHGGFRAAMFTYVMMGFQNMAFISLACNFSTYLIQYMCYNLADSATALTNFMGTAYLLGLLGAYISDSYLSRLRTVVISASIAFVGYVVLAIQAHIPNLRPPLTMVSKGVYACIPGSATMNVQQSAIMYLGLYLIAIGVGGILPAGATLGADQFDEKDPIERKHKSSYFNWLLFSVVLGGIVGVTFIVWLETTKGFYGGGYGISAAGMLLGILCIIMGVNTYRHKVLGDSPLLRIAQVFISSFANRNLSLPERAEELYEIDLKGSKLQIEYLPHTDSMRLLDKAAIVAEGSKGGHQCTVTQVEEAKMLVRTMPIFACTILMSTCMAQLQTLSVLQGFNMDRKLGSALIPPASLPIIPFLFMIVLTPVYEKIFVPFARRFTGLETGITYLQRVGVGLVLSIISMSIAGLVEVKRKEYAKQHAPQSMSMFYLSFQYFVFGIADLFTLVGLLDFFYSQCPAGMKSLSTCFTWVSLSLGFFFSSVLVNIVNAATRHNTKSKGWLIGIDLNKNNVDLFYWLLAILSTLNFIIYLYCAKRYQYRQPAKDQNQEDHKAPMDSTTADQKTPINSSAPDHEAPMDSAAPGQKTPINSSSPEHEAPLNSTAPGQEPPMNSNSPDQKTPMDSLSDHESEDKKLPTENEFSDLGLSI